MPTARRANYLFENAWPGTTFATVFPVVQKGLEAEIFGDHSREKDSPDDMRPGQTGFSVFRRSLISSNVMVF